MSYIGNSPSVQTFTPQVDYFSGNGSTTSFTLSRTLSSTAGAIVVVANVVQNPGSAYTVSGSTLTFTSAPPNGSNNIWVEYTSLVTQSPTSPVVATVADGTMYLNSQTLRSPYTLPIGYNAISVGPITVSANVTIQNTSRWVIV